MSTVPTDNTSPAPKEGLGNRRNMPRREADTSAVPTETITNKKEAQAISIEPSRHYSGDEELLDLHDKNGDEKGKPFSFNAVHDKIVVTERENEELLKRVAVMETVRKVLEKKVAEKDKKNEEKERVLDSIVEGKKDILPALLESIEARSQLEKQLAEAKIANASLKEIIANASLKKEMAEAKIANAYLKKEMAKAKEENASLEMEMTQVTKKNASLKKAIADLIEI